ncbi:hypothetical protein Tco_1014990 [Tanacetum coccineum]
MVIPNYSSSGTKKYQGSNSSDGGNTRDGVKIAGGVMGSGGEIGHVGGLEGDEEGLEDEMYKLESSYGMLVCPCDAAAKKEEKEVMWLILRPRME